MIILLYVVHGRIVTAPRVVGVDAYEQKLDEVGCNLWDTSVPWETRRDVAGLELGLLAVVFLGGPVSEVYAFLFRVAVRTVCRFIDVRSD